MGKPQRIERSSLIGKDRKSIITSGVDRVYDITVDHKEQTLYWVDAGRHTLESADFNGRNRRLLTRMNSVKFTSVVVFGVRIKHFKIFMLYIHSFKHILLSGKSKKFDKKLFLFDERNFNLRSTIFGYKKRMFITKKIKRLPI